MPRENIPVARFNFVKPEFGIESDTSIQKIARFIFFLFNQGLVLYSMSNRFIQCQVDVCDLSVAKSMANKIEIVYSNLKSRNPVDSI